MYVLIVESRCILKYCYKLPFFNANKTITAGPDNIIIPVANNCPIICQLIILESLFINF